MPHETINPATGQTLASFPCLTRAEVELVLAGASEAQRAWAGTSFELRRSCLRRAAVLLRERANELAELLALEMGKPLREGVAEANKCAWACEHYADHAERDLAPRDTPTDAGTSHVRFEPLGVVLAIMPWNYPLWQTFRFLAPNLMAGNGGLLKPAPNVPQCALATERLLRDAGFPASLFRVLLVETDDVAAIIEDPRVAGVTLTGSERAGRAVGATAGRALKPVVLELGGSDPFIVLADADLAAAATCAAAARTLNAGQSCIAAKRFIVEAPVYDRFLDLFAHALAQLKVGDPFDPATDLGPLARLELRDALHRQVQGAVQQGARLVMGGVVPATEGAYYPVTLLADVLPGNVAAREELFGPVAALLKAKDADDAVALANGTRFGLGASLWTSDGALARRLVPRLEAGAVFVNGMVKSDPRLPFGGVKASGVGRELGLEGLLEFVNVKSVWIR